MNAGYYTAAHSWRGAGRLNITSVCFESEERADLWREFLESEDAKKPKARRRKHIVISVLTETPKATEKK